MGSYSQAPQAYQGQAQRQAPQAMGNQWTQMAEQARNQVGGIPTPTMPSPMQSAAGGMAGQLQGATSQTGMAPPPGMEAAAMNAQSRVGSMYSKPEPPRAMMDAQRQMAGALRNQSGLC